MRRNRSLKLPDPDAISSTHSVPGVALEHVHRHPAFQHHFDDMDQQFETSHFGMWVFLVTEVMFFGGLFAAYTIYRTLYPAAFADTSRHMDVILGGLNTGVLIGSSLTMALAVHAAQTNARKLLPWFLIGTIVLGTIFLVVKAFEYTHKWHEHLVPGPYFQYDGPYAAQAQILFSFYFIMTGMHAVHMIVGIGLLAYLVWQARRQAYSSEYFTPVEMVGLYWHFVDIVWIFLFPLLYLIGQHNLGGH
jgi:cytochrome c oxidase subunit 3